MWLSIARGVGVAVLTGCAAVLSDYAQSSDWQKSALAGAAVLVTALLAQLGGAGAVAAVKAAARPPALK